MLINERRDAVQHRVESFQEPQSWRILHFFLLLVLLRLGSTGTNACQEIDLLWEAIVWVKPCQKQVRIYAFRADKRRLTRVR